MLDVLIRGGTVVDGAGGPGRRADVAIERDRVVAIGPLESAVAARVFDARGLIIAPGFIDIHSHSDFTVLADPRVQSSIAQGVTTEIIGNCGHGCAPIADAQQVIGNIYGYLEGFPLGWRSTAEYFARLDAAGPAVNVAALVPNGNLRLATLGLTDRPATPAELTAMASLLAEGLEAGAFGFSTGLEYPSERATTEAEITHLCRIAAGAGGIYATHTRNRDTHAVEAIEEALRLAASTGIRLQISHITPRKGGAPDSAARAIDAVDGAIADGQDIAFDMHTRLFGFTNLSAALPAWVTQGNDAEIRARLRQPAVRDEIKRFESLITSFGRAGWENVRLLPDSQLGRYAGKSIQDLAGETEDPVDVVIDVLAETCGSIHVPMCLCQSYTEDELLATYRHFACTIGSDATALSTDGPLADSVFPGAFTWAAWFFRRFVRERGAFSIEEAVAKMAREPAERIGLKGRGVLEVGAFADVIVFDPRHYGETGTIDQPNSPAAGMKHVLVNGVVTRLDGVDTGIHGGRVLRRNWQA